MSAAAAPASLTAPRSLPFDRARLRKLAGAITAGLGIKMPDGKLTMLHGRLQRRLGQLGLDSLAAYEARLADPAHAAAERTALFDLATTNKTDFFREPDHFAFLARRVLPALAATAPRVCRVWCAGCATGQEAYTLAIVLAEHRRAHPGFDFEILATDVSTRVLREAARATYAAAVVAPVPAALRQRYFLRGTGARAGELRVVPELRAKVRFFQLNFMAGSYALPGGLDVVFFRNVLIYFDRATQEQVLARQCALLRRGGYLFVGHSESVTGFALPLVAEATSVLRRT